MRLSPTSVRKMVVQMPWLLVSRWHLWHLSKQNSCGEIVAVIRSYLSQGVHPSSFTGTLLGGKKKNQRRDLFNISEKYWIMCSKMLMHFLLNIFLQILLLVLPTVLCASDNEKGKGLQIFLTTDITKENDCTPEYFTRCRKNGPAWI